MWRQKIAVFALPDRLGHQKERPYAQAIAESAVCLVNEGLELIPEARLHRGEGVAVCAMLPGASGENPALRRNSPSSLSNNSFGNTREMPSLSAGAIPGAADAPQFEVVIFCGGRP